MWTYNKLPPTCTEFAQWYATLDLKKIVANYTVGQPVGYMFTSDSLSLNDIEKSGVSVTFLECEGGKVTKVNPADLAGYSDAAQRTPSQKVYFQNYAYYTIAEYSAPTQTSEGLWPMSSLQFQKLGAKTSASSVAATNLIVLMAPR